MNAQVSGHNILVTLSERNLRTLLSKLQRPNSACTLIRLTDEDYHLVVRAESDADHYGGRDPGAVHPLDDPAVAA